MKTMEEKKYNHIELNNEVTKRKDNGFFNLEKDQEALKVYLEEIHDKMISFDDEIERLHYLVDNNFYFNVFEKYSEAKLLNTQNQFTSNLLVICRQVSFIKIML